MAPKISPQEHRRRRAEADARLKGLDRLAALPPPSPMGQVVFVWPRIATALERGHKLKAIWAQLKQDGFALSWPHFKTCVWRIRKGEKKLPQREEGKREVSVQIVSGGPGPLFQGQPSGSGPDAPSSQGDLDGLDDMARRALAILEKKGPDRLT